MFLWFNDDLNLINDDRDKFNFCTFEWEVQQNGGAFGPMVYTSHPDNYIPIIM